MAKFSQRHGHSPLEGSFQRETIDQDLRTKLWNILKISIWDVYDLHSYDHGIEKKTAEINYLVRRLWFNFLNNDMDALPEFRRNYREGGAYGVLKKFFFDSKWFEVYDFLEAISDDPSKLLTEKTQEWINQELERHNSAYRFVGGKISEITSETEIAAIEDGLTDADASTKQHLEAALRMLSDREAPDYRNSVKESISAVEAACRRVTKLPSATLGDALKKVANMHPAFSKAFGALYGYTSDASGIRHALTDEATVSYEDAKFMLVTCSAFVSFMKASAKDA